MSSYVYEVPSPDEDLCIVIGDDYLGATLTLSVSPGTGTYFANLSSTSSSKKVPFDVVANTSTEIVISMTDATTRRLKPGRYEWSLLFRDTGASTDRTVCRGYADVVEFPTSNI